ncbi:MAG: DivIVA domain-containing protein [Nitrospinota bacterium]
MKIAPIDIRQQRFSVKFRGFDPQEVDSFLEMVAEELEDFGRENARLKEDLNRLHREIEELRTTEGEVKKTLLAAQTLKEDISANARKEAELILRDARSKANDILGSTRSAASGVREELSALVRRKKQLILNLRSMLETHLRMLEAEEKDDAPLKADASAPEFRSSDTSEGTSRPESLPEPSRTDDAKKSDSTFSVFLPGERLDK